MTHNVESMAYAGEKPWHGLGVEVDPSLSAADMMRAAGLDWKVVEVPTFANYEVDGEMRKIPTNQKAILRETDGQLLSTVGANWHPVQNEQAFEFFEEFVEAGNMSMETAGSLGNGKMVWGLARTGHDFELFGGDRIESFLLFSNPHEYGKRIEIRNTPIRVVCQNTLSIATENVDDRAVRLDHRTAFRPEVAKNVVARTMFRMNNYKSLATLLGTHRAAKEDVREFLAKIVGVDKTNSDKLSRTGEQIFSTIPTQPGAEFAEGTWWQVYNAVTYHADHVAGRTVSTRLTSSWFGKNEKMKRTALELAGEYAAKSPDNNSRKLVAA